MNLMVLSLFNKLKKNMKKSVLSLLILLFFSSMLTAQINLVGVANNQQTGKIDVVKWEALNPASVSVFPSMLDGYYFASSAFDSYNSNYYLTGISGDNSGLYSFNTRTNQENLGSASLYSNISEFDMSTGIMYNLKMMADDSISVFAYNINTNQDSLLGVIYEPGVNGIVVDAIGFDANNGILYYVGFTGDPALCLYAIPVRESQFSFTKTNLVTNAPYNNIQSVNFDNVNERIFARNATFDTTGTYISSFIVEINKTTGDIINLAELVEFPYFVGGSSSFDQNTGTLMLVGIDTSNMLKMIAFNSSDNTYVSGFVPGNISEIVCDNSEFVQNNYILTGVKAETAISFDVYPNPATELLTIDYPTTEKLNIQLISSDGKRVLSQDFASGERLVMNVADLLPGLYVVKLLSGGKTATQKIVLR